MPKVTKQRARKPYSCGTCGCTIEPGIEYYKFQRFNDAKPNIRCIEHYPKAKELTGSYYLQTVYGWEDGSYESKEDLESLMTEVESLKEETEGSFDNMPEGLQQGDTGQQLESRVEMLGDLEERLEEAISELESWEEEFNENEIDEDVVVVTIEDYNEKREELIAGVVDTIGDCID